jgi:TonB family protein
MKPAGDPYSCDSKPNNNYFNVTIIDSRGLPARLIAELSSVSHELRGVLLELRRDPFGVSSRLSSQAVTGVRRRLAQPDLLVGHASGLLVVISMVLLIIAAGRTKTIESQTGNAHDFSPDDVVMLDSSAAADVTAGGYDLRARGRVGLRSEKGEGSAPDRMRAQGGGTGGLGHTTPAQRGKIPPPSAIPAPIPIHPPLNPTLPVAGIDLDPLLWRDIKYPAYGVPSSALDIPSNGPGTGGGMGTNNGLGIGDGRGNGYGPGTDGNTGGGQRQLGWGGVGGGPPGGLGGRDRVFRSNEVEQKVRLLSKPEPHYSEEARRNQISGTVVLRVIFTSTGEVTQIRAVSTLPFGLTERAIAAARQIKFLPATSRGRPVSVYMQLEYNFNLY